MRLAEKLDWKGLNVFKFSPVKPSSICDDNIKVYYKMFGRQCVECT
jgi:hypothetical protein